jgi:uncharacterized protein DUF2834
MPRARVILCWLYGAASLLALVGTWRQNVAYFRPEDGALLGFVLATGRFWVDTVVNPASTSITVDLGLLLLLPLFALMIIESRRLGIPFVWAYILLGLVVAISATFPLFLIARERRLAARAASTDSPGFTTADASGMLLLTSAAVVFTFWTIAR